MGDCQLADCSILDQFNFVGLLKEIATGNECILLAVQNLSRWSVASAIAKNYFNSSVVIKLIEEQIS